MCEKELPKEGNLMKRKVIAMAALSLVGLTGLMAAPAFADGTSNGRFPNQMARKAYFQNQKQQQAMVNQYNNNQYLMQQQAAQNPYYANQYFGNPYANSSAYYNGNGYYSGNGYYNGNGYGQYNSNSLGSRFLNWF